MTYVFNITVRHIAIGAGAALLMLFMVPFCDLGHIILGSVNP